MSKQPPKGDNVYIPKRHRKKEPTTITKKEIDHG